MDFDGILSHFAATTQAATNTTLVTTINFGVLEIVGLVLMIILTGLHSVAGLGGGGPNVVILILLFGLVPKQATIAVFSCIFGGAAGNMINQMRRVIDK